MTVPKTPAILIVEDEAIAAVDLQETLKLAGYDPYAIASSAEEAIAAAGQRCPDLVLMDIRIKGKRDGVETAAILRERFFVPVIYLTAHADEATIARAKETSPYGYLLKPLRTSELRGAIEVALYRHETEKRLRERERWFATTLRCIGDAVITVDLAGKITFMNEVAERLTRVKLAEAIGRPAHEVVELEPSAERVETPALERALREVRTVELEEATLRGPTSRIIADSAAPVIDQGELLGAVMVFRDVTDQKRLQQQLEINDRLASLGTMAAGVAHEVNNPLAVILAQASFMAGEVKPVRDALAANGLVSPRELTTLLNDVLEAQAEIQAASVRIQRIVADLKAFSRPTEEVQGIADVARTIQWACSSTRSELANRAQVFVNVEGKDLSARIDELRLGQVLVNLLTNAGQAMAQPDSDQNCIRIRASRQEDWIVIEVSDTGAGMPPEVRQRIFEPFFSTKPVGVGTGLGLAICHGIVNRAGGHIEVESTPERGSVFSVWLPVGRRGSVPPVLEPAMTFGRPGRVLVVDDDEPLLRILVRMLSEHDVTSVTSAKQALALLRTHTFDVVVSDLMMPEMSGIELYETILERHPLLAQSVLFITGGTTTARAEDFRRSVNNRFLDKPFRPEQLRRAVQELLLSKLPTPD